MKKVSFEDKIKELEQIVSELEKGDLTLEKSISNFETGMKISKECSKLLEDTEKRISIILEKDGEISEEDFSSKE